MFQFNANWELVNCLRQMVKDAGIVLPEPSEGRQKVSGFMGSRGEYTIGECIISTYGHYNDKNDDQHYSLKFYKKMSAGWHLARDKSGKVFFSEIGFFDQPIDKVTDWQETPFVIN